MQGYKAISSHLDGWNGSIAGFVRDLDRRGARYIAYTQISALEFCPYRYYLECVKRIRPRPQPDYFTKGTIFHAAAAKYYRGLFRKRSVTIESLHALIDRHDRLDGHHLKNAITLALQNAHDEWEVVAVEEPFVLSLSDGQPPCIGVVDLILRKGKHYVVVDHKTGNRFYEPDELQIAIYREFVRRRFQSLSCTAFFDQYRWVNNLDRIRKPAFQRTEIKCTSKEWRVAEQKLARSYQRMQSILEKDDAPGTGECFLCPLKDQCKKASFNSYGGW
ncbi:MAG TPA: PD-(D/E)XK nuclease family protein [Pirellulales bacterium]|jgi:hypothetical protein|nr:PD-(D/E)XK nuclease family protein [Pirellulales bacterium]